MPNVFVKKSAEELYVELSDGRMMPLEALVKGYENYERLLKKKTSKKAVVSGKKNDKAVMSDVKANKAVTTDTKTDKAVTKELKPGEWFRIDRNVIDKNRDKIRRKCIEAGTVGKEFWERFKESNKIADENPDQYSRLIDTYIFVHDWSFKYEWEMKDMCKQVGHGMCDEIICDLELQMRICNGESVVDLFKKVDKLPFVRFIKLKKGETGFFGGSNEQLYRAPAEIHRNDYHHSDCYFRCTPYAFRRVLS